MLKPRYVTIERLLTILNTMNHRVVSEVTIVEYIKPYSNTVTIVFKLYTNTSVYMVRVDVTTIDSVRSQIHDFINRKDHNFKIYHVTE